MNVDRVSTPAKSAAPAHARKVFEFNCATCDKMLTLTGKAGPS